MSAESVGRLVGGGVVGSAVRLVVVVSLVCVEAAEAVVGVGVRECRVVAAIVA